VNQLFRLVSVKLVVSGTWCNFIGGRMTLSEHHRNSIGRCCNQRSPSVSFPLGQFLVCVLPVSNMAADLLLGEFKRGNCVGEPGRTVAAQQAQQSQFFGRNYKFFNVKQFLSLGSCYRLMHRAWACKYQMGITCTQIPREGFKTRGKAGCNDIRPERLSFLASSLLLRGDPQRCTCSAKRSQGSNCTPNSRPVVLFKSEVQSRCDQGSYTRECEQRVSDDTRIPVFEIHCHTGILS